MGAAAVPLLVAATVAGTGYSIYSGRQAQKDQQKQLETLAGQKPPPATPPPTAADKNPGETVADRQKKLAAMQYGFASTISNLSPQNPTGLKTKLGQ